MTPPSPGGSRHRFFSDALVATGLVTATEMEHALDRARSGGLHPSEVIEADGGIDADALAHAIAEHFRIDHVDLDAFAVEPQAAALPGGALAEAQGVLPIAVLDCGTVVVATHDPERCDLIQIGDLLGREVQPAVASRPQLRRHLAMSRSAPSVAPPAPGRSRDVPVLTVVPPSPEAPTASASERPEPVPPAPEPVGGAEVPDERPDTGLATHLARAEAAEARCARLEAELQAAEQRADVAEARPEAMTTAAAVANEALGHLATARADAERAAGDRAQEFQALRADLAELRRSLRDPARAPAPPQHVPSTDEADVAGVDDVAAKAPAPGPTAQASHALGPPPGSGPVAPAPAPPPTAKARGLRRMIRALRS